MHKLVKKEQLSNKELQELLKARENNEIEFTLIDVREPFEYEMQHIVKTDELLPTSSFNSWVHNLLNRKDENIILYCRSGNRSYQVQQILEQHGMKVGNLELGILDYTGKTAQGKFIS